jgi:hypothetical protein
VLDGLTDNSADIVLVSLPTPDVVKAVALDSGGIIEGTRAKILIDLSTTGPGAAKIIADGLKLTAPNNGTAGIIPAVLRYFRDFCPEHTQGKHREFLLTAAAIGGIIKKNASISGAEVGCQGRSGRQPRWRPPVSLPCWAAHRRRSKTPPR